MIGNSAGTLKGAGLTSSAIPPGAITEDRSKLPVLKGKLKKQSRKGKWQTRYFRTTNYFLTYYKTQKYQKICCCHDICTAVRISTTGRFGYFDIEFDDNVVSLKADSLDEAEKWVDNLNARAKLFANESSSQIPTGAGTSEKREILIQGMLQKKSPTRFRGWQPRYFILTPGELRYFKQKPQGPDNYDDFVGVVHIAGIVSVFPSSTNSEECCFLLNTSSHRTFELKAGSSKSCAEWIIAIDSAKHKSGEVTSHLDEKIAEVEEAARQALIPELIKEFDRTDAGERAMTTQMKFIEAFEHVDKGGSIEDMVGVLTDILEELSDMIDTCNSVEPPRLEIVNEHIDYYHPLILFKITNCITGIKEEQLQAHEALRIMDFIKAYTDLLERTEHTEVAGDAFSNEDGDVIDFLTRSYVKKAGPDLERMVHSIAQFVLTRPEDAIREDEDGMFSTTAPIDLVNMINQYLDIVGRSGAEALQARVLRMCLKKVETYCHDLEIHISGDMSGDELVFLVAIANDADIFVDRLDTIEDDYSDLIERRDLEENFSHVIHRCQQLGRLALHQLCDIIFADLLPLEEKLFDKDWLGGSLDTIDTMLATIEDYFEDFYGKLRNGAFGSLAGYCYDQMIIFYVRRLINRFTRAHSRKHVRHEPRTYPTQEAMNMVSRDFESILHMFRGLLDGKEDCGSPERAYRTQIQFSEFVEDILHRTSSRDLHAGVFTSMCNSLKKNENALAHAYALVLYLTLMRDFKHEHKLWCDMDSMLTDGERKYSPKPPPNRVEILRLCSGSLAGTYSMTHDTIVCELQTLVDKAAARHQILTDTSKVEKKDDDQAGAIKEAKLQEIREDYSQPLVVRVCNGYSNVLTQIVYDHDVTLGRKRIKSKSKSWIRAKNAHKAMSLAQKLKNGANAAMATMKTPSKANKTRAKNNATTNVNEAVEQMYREGVITKEEYVELITQHQKFEEADEKFEREKIELASPDRIDEFSHEDPRFQALQNAKQLLEIGAITQHEYDELEQTIHSAHQELNGDPDEILEKADDPASNDNNSGDNNDGSGSNGSSSSSTSSSDGGSGSSSSSSDSESEGDDATGDAQDEYSMPENASNIFSTSADISEEAQSLQDPRQDPNQKMITKSKKRSIGLHLGDGTETVIDLEELRGYMMKKPKAMSKWRRRWFSVTRVYNEDLQALTMSMCWHADHNSPPIKALPIKDILDVSLTEAKNNFKVTFRIGAKSKKTVLLKSESDKECDLWVSALSKFVQDSRERIKNAYLDKRDNNLSASGEVSAKIDSDLDEAEDSDNSDASDFNPNDYSTPIDKVKTRIHRRGSSGSLSQRSRTRSALSESLSEATPASDANHLIKRKKSSLSKRTSIFLMPSPASSLSVKDKKTKVIRPDFSQLTSLKSASEMRETSTEKHKESHFKADGSMLETNDDAFDWKSEELSIPAKQGGCGACTIS